MMKLNSMTLLQNVSQHSSCNNTSDTSTQDGCSKALHCEDFTLSSVDIVVSVVLYTIIAITGSVGNLLVLLVIKQNPNLKTTYGVFIANLAIADLIVTAVAVPLLLPMLTQGFIPTCAPNGLVIALIIAGRFSGTASLLLLAAMSIDRCWAVCCPIQHKRRMTSSKLKAVLLFIWLASLTLPTLEIVLRRERRSLSAVYQLTNSGIIICFAIFVISGLLIVINIRRVSSKVGSMDENGGTSYMHIILRERNKQVSKTVALVVVCFSLCWLPVAYIIARRDKYYSAQNYWSLLPVFANSSINSLIYFFRERSYRRALKVLLRSVLLGET